LTKVENMVSARVSATATGATIACVLAGTGVPAAHAAATGSCTTPSATGAVTCTYDDPRVKNYALHVPAGVTTVHISAHGAAGGAGGTLDRRVATPQGGPGGLVAADFPVRPGDVLYVLVGGHGRDADGITPGAGGLNGGGKGGAGAPAGGGGGGASTVRLRGADVFSRILVAGGGGGGGGALSTALVTSNGGAGGGDRGENGVGDVMGQGGIGAVGGSGGAGLDTLSGQDGHDGYDADWGGGGGEGGSGASSELKHGGSWGAGAVGAGGGGGGYAGGSGGAAGTTVGGGGGGGSGLIATSWVAPTTARLGSGQMLTGQGSEDDGIVTISYTLPIGKRGKAPAGVVPTGTFVAKTDE
jgi:hypothetical protein